MIILVDIRNSLRKLFIVKHFVIHELFVNYQEKVGWFTIRDKTKKKKRSEVAQSINTCYLYL